MPDSSRSKDRLILVDKLTPAEIQRLAPFARRYRPPEAVRKEMADFIQHFLEEYEHDEQGRE
jgi:hypothetical protein